MLKYALIMISLMATSAMAQTLPSKDVDTVRSGIGEESLAPVVVPQPVISKTTPVTVPTAVPVVAPMAATSVVSSTAGLAVSETAPIDAFTVKKVVVTLSDTMGFDRDVALEKGAKQAMPGVLVAMGMDTATAAKSVKELGSPMNFVKSFKVVKETLIPAYVLTADLTFNETMLRKNFGGKIPAKVVGAEVVTPATDASGDGGDTAPLKQWVVRVTDRDPAAVERVRTNLNAQASTRATYRLLTSAGAEMVVETPMDAMGINRVAGHEVMVSELESTLPTAVVDLPGIVSGTWEGGAAPTAGTSEETY